MKRMTKIGIYGMAVWLLSACGNGTPDYDATGTFEATEVIVSAEAAGKLLQLEVEEGTRLKAGEEVGLQPIPICLPRRVIMQPALFLRQDRRCCLPMCSFRV